MLSALANIGASTTAIRQNIEKALCCGLSPQGELSTDTGLSGYTRIEAGSKMYFPYSGQRETFLSVQIHKGNGEYGTRWVNHPLHPKSDTNFCVTSNGTMEPRSLWKMREKYPDHVPTDETQMKQKPFQKP